MMLGFASGCFLERRKEFIIPRKVPEELKSFPVELQVGRGYDYSDFEKVVSIHLPFMLYKMLKVEGVTVYRKLREVNIASLEEDFWRADFELFKKYIIEAAEKGVKYAVFHYGSCNCRGRLWRDENHRMLHWSREKDFLMGLSELAENVGIKLLAENHPYTDGIFLNHIKHVKEIVEGGYAGFCLDFPHAFYRFKRFGEASLKEIITKFKDNLQELHLADNNGSNHAPSALDEGKIDWRELVSLLGNSLLIIIELRENPLESLKKAQQVMLNTLR
ncbi:MAG: sugar phosphate isomerase/epimerase [Candidatus Jordarchaeaceae archaeon]